MTPQYYVVGGSVRDGMLGLSSKDIDYAVEAESFDAMVADLEARGAAIFLKTPEYVTVRAKLNDALADFVLCRKDGAYRDGRHPESVSVGTIYDDLARRDFTMNAMAVAEDGTLLDPHNGAQDIASRLVRCVGDTRERFTEDGLRMLRAVRFAITKDFALSDAICSCLWDAPFVIQQLERITVERIREELYRCCAHDTARTITYLAQTFPVLSYQCFQMTKLWLKPTLELKRR